MRPLDGVVRPPRAPQSIVVYERAPEKSYTVIARIDSRTDSPFRYSAVLRAKIIEKAARLGGDAVIIGSVVRETNVIILPTGFLPSENRRLAAEVIIFH